MYRGAFSKANVRLTLAKMTFHEVRILTLAFVDVSKRYVMERHFR